MNTLLQHLALSDCRNKISQFISSNPNCHFKIGKTSQPLEIRFKNGYAEDYDKIIQVYMSNDAALIDWLEKVLIEEYMSDYPLRYDNKQIGGGPDEEDIALVGMIYIVVKE